MYNTDIQNDYDFIAYTRSFEKEMFIKQMEWILSRNDWKLFTATMAFKGLRLVESAGGMRRRVMQEWNSRVLPKIKRCLGRSRKLWNKLVPIDYLIQYEYEQGSYFKPIPQSNSPHHIHGLLPIHESVVGRLYDFDTHSLNSRLVKDLKSIATVSTFLIEPLRAEESQNWINYVMKGKSSEDYRLEY